MHDFFQQAVSAFGQKYVILACIVAVCILLTALPRVFESFISLLRYIIGLLFTVLIFFLIHLRPVFSRNKEGKPEEEAKTITQIVQVVVFGEKKHNENTSDNGKNDKTNTNDTKAKTVSFAEHILSWFEKNTHIP